jgi:hydroxyacylglutathione hydrolase
LRSSSSTNIRPRPFFSTSSSSSSSSMSSNNNNSSSSIEVIRVPCLDDNYGWIIHDKVTKETAVVDTPEAAPYLSELTKRGWTLTHIFNTHHHWDHTGSNLELKKKDVTIYGPVKEQSKIPGIDIAVGNGDTISFGDETIEILDVGGHTKGHIAYHFPHSQLVFPGDAIFALGCGKMFEGTPTQFWNSLSTLRSLPDPTIIYCAHEYTMGNAKFAMSVEPSNEQLVERVKDVYDKRSKGLPTVPSTMGEEKQTNPFLRFDISEEIRTNVGANNNDDLPTMFAKVRSAKDNFRG